jgi:hypothetical protein
LSTALTELPAPSHWFVLQSPGVCCIVGVPAGENDNPHAPALHERALHSVSWPGHCGAALHWTHVAEALQNVPPFWLHGELTGFAGCPGTPLLHVSLVQSFPSSAGTSPFASVGTTLPAPSHWFTLQSPGVCLVAGLPAATKVIAHALFVQVRTEQSASMPGHWLATLQATHDADAEQNDPPFWLHAVSTDFGGWDGTPLVHTSSVHWLPSSEGTSVSSATVA